MSNIENLRGGGGDSVPAVAVLESVAMPAPVLIPSKYQAAIMSVILTVLFAFQTSLTGGISEVEAWNLAALATGTVVTYWAPLLASNWSAILKVLGAVLGAVLVAVIAVVDTANGGTGWGAETITAVVFAGVNALAASIGVHRRVDEAEAALRDPAIDNADVQAADAGATKAAAFQLAH